jgi:N-acetylneuraminic acid mutarotase
MLAARGYPAAAVINNVLYVAGGNNGHETPTLQAYNPSTNAWTALADMPSGRYQGDGAAVINGQLYVPGGWDNSYSFLPHSDLFVYDPATNTWASRASMPLLSGCGASAAINGKLYVTTPCNGYSGVQTFLHVYDPVTNTWSSLASSPHGHEVPAAGVIGGKFYVAGGSDGSDSTGYLDVYDPATNTWTTKAPMPIGVLAAAGAVIKGNLYVVGGNALDSHGNAGPTLATVEVYDPVTDTWATDTSMPTARNGPAAGVVNGVMYVVGGVNGNGVILATNEAFTPGPVISLPPVITSLSPSSAREGGATFTLTVNGANFTTSSTVKWNSAALATTFVSSTQLQATVPAANVAEEGSTNITVSDPSGGTSNAQTFAIADPAVSPTGGFTVRASEGANSGSQTVATFTDPGGAEALTDYSASIAWGDSATSPGTITYSNGVFTVSGSHQYAEEGSYAITVTIHHDSAPDASANSTATVADPAVSSLAFSTYLGGSGSDYGRAIAVDAGRNTYVTGHTESPNFPVTPGAFDTTYPAGAGSAGFVAKFNSSGALVWATYLGGPGPGNDPLAIAVDSSGNVYVTGNTSSTAFPTTAGAFQTSFAGGVGGGPVDAFVTKLNPSGSALVYSTYLGGSNQDFGGEAIAVDAAGNAYVTGETRSSDFPTTAGAFQTTLNAFQGAFVTKLNPTGSALVYSTYLSGSSGFIQDGFGIALDASGDAYVTGRTDATNFPTTPGAFQSTKSGGGGFENFDAFVTELNPAGSGLLYSTYLGGSVSDEGDGIVVDGSGNAYVAGYTGSANFPTTAGAFQSALAGGRDAFVTKLNPSGTGLVYSTYLGGSGDELVGEGGNPITLDASGNAYVVGWTSSTNFPTVNPVQAANGGGRDAFVAKLNASGTGLGYSSYLGGSGDDTGSSIAVDGSGNAYVTGSTTSSNFPTANAFQAANAGGTDAFVAKIMNGFTVSATEGANSGSQTVATFTDPGGAEALTDYSATIAWGDNATSAGTITYSNGVFTVSGSHQYAEEGSYPITVTIHHDSAPDATAKSTATVADAPLAATGQNFNGQEGISIASTVASFTDADPNGTASDYTATINWGDGSPVSSGTIGASGSTFAVSGSHTYAEEGTYTVSVTIRDQGGSAVTIMSTATIAIVAPTASISGPTNGVPGQPRTFTFAATHPSPVDQAAGFIYTINWGDGTPVQTIPRSAGNGAGTTMDHIYTTIGSYTVQSTATEDGGSSGTVSQSLTLLTAEVQGTDLAVGGTTGNDNIFLYPADTVGHIAVTVNGVAQGNFLPTGHILVYGQSGNDTILLLPNLINGQYVQIGVPAVLFGGNGNDILSAAGSSANNVLVGGSGNNLLTGGTGRNILIAGSGTSTLVGGTGQDILIGGSTDFDHNLTALYALTAEWGRTDASYATRVSHLNGSLAGGLNGSFFLNSMTVHGNANADLLIGGLGPDWFFAAANDQLLFVFPGEIITKI